MWRCSLNCWHWLNLVKTLLVIQIYVKDLEYQKIIQYFLLIKCQLLFGTSPHFQQFHFILLFTEFFSLQIVLDIFAIACHLTCLHQNWRPYSHKFLCFWPIALSLTLSPFCNQDWTATCTDTNGLQDRVTICSFFEKRKISQTGWKFEKFQLLLFSLYCYKHVRIIRN